MPPLELATDPPPVPVVPTVSAASAVNNAEALRSAVMSRVQVTALPLQAPLQPVKLAPGTATAVSVSVVPLA